MWPGREKGGDICPQEGQATRVEHYQDQQSRLQDGPPSVGLHSCHVKRASGGATSYDADCQ